MHDKCGMINLIIALIKFEGVKFEGVNPRESIVGVISLTTQQTRTLKIFHCKRKKKSLNILFVRRVNAELLFNSLQPTDRAVHYSMFA